MKPTVERSGTVGRPGAERPGSPRRGRRKCVRQALPGAFRRPLRGLAEPEPHRYPWFPQFRFAPLWALIRRPFQGLKSLC